MVCTRAIRNIDPKLALSVGGERDPGKITLDHWISLAKLCDLRQRYMLSVIEEVATGLKDNFKSVQDEFESKYGAYEALQRVKSVVEKQCGKMLKELSKKT